MTEINPEEFKDAILKFEISGDYLNIYFKEALYTIPLRAILSEPGNVENLLKLIFADFQLDTKNDFVPKSLVYSKASNKVYLTKFLGALYVFLYDKIDFEGNEITNAIPNLKDDKAIFIWDNYVFYVDGNISDLSFTWRMKISNTPLDYIVSENRIYVLDITGQLVILNSKSRRIIFSKIFPGAYMINQEPAGSLLVHTQKGRYKIINESEVVFEEKFESFNSIENSTKFYPSISNLNITPFGYFYNDIFIGEELRFSYIKNKVLYLITEVGIWKIRISD